MSLALNVEAGARRGASRAALVLAATMCAVLLVAAWHGWQATEGAAPGPRWWLPLACAFACVACWLVEEAPWGAARDRAWRLVIAPDGAARLAVGAGAAPVAAEVVGAWGLGRVLYLRLRAAGTQRDTRLLLLRADVTPAQWHGLRRWQVWLRRSRNAHRTNTRSA